LPGRVAPEPALPAALSPGFTGSDTDTNTNNLINAVPESGTEGVGNGALAWTGSRSRRSRTRARAERVASSRRAQPSRSLIPPASDRTTDPPRLHRALGLHDLVLLDVACIVGLSSLAQLAQFGDSHVHPGGRITGSGQMSRLLRAASSGSLAPARGLRLIAFFEARRPT
jgi:hypothetical protein